MARWKNMHWNLRGNESDHTVPNDNIKLALLMDIRDELLQLNRVFACHNAQAIPGLLRKIARNTTKRRKPAPKKRKH